MSHTNRSAPVVIPWLTFRIWKDTETTSPKAQHRWEVSKGVGYPFVSGMSSTEPLAARKVALHLARAVRDEVDDWVLEGSVGFQLLKKAKKEKG